MKDRELLDHMERHGNLPRSVAEELVRDLRYAPDQVRWTEPQYQPLIPVGQGSYAFIGVVVGGSNYERNLLALIDKLPWRTSVSHKLKDEREPVMLAKIRNVTTYRPWAERSRLLVGSKTQRVGDVDLLLWTSDPDEALVLSLKWLYGPDSVQEMWNHSEEYRQALKELERVSLYLGQNAEEVSRRQRLEPPLTMRTHVLSALVTYADEVLFGDRRDDIPCVTLPQLLNAIERFDSLGSLHDELRRISSRRPPLPEESDFSSLQLGPWRFRLPYSRSDG